DVDDHAVLEDRGERDDLDVGEAAPQLARGLDAVHDRHQQVHDDDVRPQALDEVQGLAAIPLAGVAIAAIAPSDLGGGAFLASLGLAFAVSGYEDKTRWWALLPAGTLATLGLVAFFEGVLGASAGWLFLIGMALTFFALTRLEVEPQPGAIWPAAGLALLALFGFMDARGGWVLPALRIAAGAVMLLRDEGRFGISVKVTRSGPRQADAPPAAPTVDVEPPPPAPQPPAADGARGAGTGQA